MTSIHSIAAPAVAPDLLDARDALDVLGEKLELLRLALGGLRASPHERTPEMIDPLLAFTDELHEASRIVSIRLGQ